MMTVVMRSITDTGNSKHVQSAFGNEKNLTYVGNLLELLCFVLKCSTASLFGKYSILTYHKSLVFSKTSKYRIKIG
jgi:hypothetical protein